MTLRSGPVRRLLRIKAFEGKSQASLIAAILERAPPPVSATEPLAPPPVDRIVKKCLAKDPDERWQTAADLKSELKWVADAGVERDAPIAAVAVKRSRGTARERVAWIVAGLSLAALIAALVFGRPLSRDRGTGNPRAYRSSIILPEGVRLLRMTAGRFALSPDGSRLVFVTQDRAGQSMLWVRSLESTLVQPLAGTEGAAFPFWSPDSRFVAFLAQGKLKKIDASGGPAVTLCDAASYGTGAWNRDGVILFTPSGGSSIFRVSASGGTPVPVTTLDAAAGDSQHWFPFFLPDGRHFLYLVLGSKARGDIDPRAVHVGSLDPNEPGKALLQGGSNAKYADGHLIYLRGRSLMAQAFDVTRLELRGEEMPLGGQVQVSEDVGTAGAFTVSDTGVIAYQMGSDVIRSPLAWFDRAGTQIALVGDQADYTDVALSADGRRAAVSRLDPVLNTRDLWLYDVARGVRRGSRSNRRTRSRRPGRQTAAASSSVPGAKAASIWLRGHRAAPDAKTCCSKAVSGSFQAACLPTADS